MKNNGNLDIIVMHVVAAPNADTYPHIMLSGKICVIGSINRPAINILPTLILFNVFLILFIIMVILLFVYIKRINASSD
ncbi:hypothetical protein AEW50_22025 [Salmonella enterica subsp. enterica serovar Hadar]|nr:hypothetical protein [Salmonella enterica]ECT0125343.1 hypothetical protein [Salmonella enterica subsp. enterica serovar Uganda]KNT46494.1 hypothetical protein AEW50_22025 [Salmonella enterica subsp. enterica serovar Hadar]